MFNLACLIFIQLASSRLYFINTPESIKHPASLCAIKFGPSHPRFFFHFKNCTGQAEHFYIRTDYAMSGNYGISVKKAPGSAGTTATYSFLSNSYTINGVFNKDIILPSGYCISGIVQCSSIVDNTFRITMGEHSSPICKVVESTNIEEHQDLSITQSEPFSFTIGERRANFILGDYGTTFSYRLNNYSNKSIQYNITAKYLQ